MSESHEPATWKLCPFCGSQDLDAQIAYWIKAKSSEAELAERDVEIETLRLILHDCLDHIAENDPMSSVIRKVLEAGR